MQAGKTLAESVGSNLNVSASKHHTIMQIITAVFLCTMCRVHVLVYDVCFCLSFCTECVEQRQASDLEVTGCPISGLPWAYHLPRFCRGIQDSRNHLLAWIWFVFCEREAKELRIRNNLRFVLQVAGGLSQHCLKPIVDVIGPLSIPAQGLRLNSDPAISTPPCELWPKMSHFLEIRPHFYILGGTDWLTGSSLIF